MAASRRRRGLALDRLGGVCRTAARSSCDPAATAWDDTRYRAHYGEHRKLNFRLFYSFRSDKELNNCMAKLITYLVLWEQQRKLDLDG